MTKYLKLRWYSLVISEKNLMWKWNTKHKKTDLLNYQFLRFIILTVKIFRNWGSDMWYFWYLLWNQTWRDLVCSNGGLPNANLKRPKSKKCKKIILMNFSAYTKHFKVQNNV